MAIFKYSNYGKDISAQTESYINFEHRIARFLRFTITSLVLLILLSTFNLTVYAEIGTRTTPFSAQINHRLNFQEYSFEEPKLIELQLQEILNGEQANTIVADENMFNEAPAYDEEWILMKFYLKYISGPEEELGASDVIWTEDSFFTPTGVKISPIDNATFSHNLSGYGQYDVKLYPGGESVVWYGILVKKSVGGYPLFRIGTSYDSSKGGTQYSWFSTNPSYVEPSSNANLSGITISNGTLNPSFNAATTNYIINLPANVNSINLVATSEDNEATIFGTGTKSLSYGNNVFIITVLAQDGITQQNYVLTIIRALPEKPAISLDSFTPTTKYGFTPGGTNKLIVTGSLTTPIPASTKMYVINSKGKTVATISKTNEITGTKTFIWDGKATAGNNAGLKVGAYVPCSKTGTLYTIKLYAQHIGGNAYSTPQTITLYFNPIISGVTITPKTFKAVSSGKNKTKITYKLNHMSNVQIQILNSSGKIVAVFKYINVIPNITRGVYWDGKATAGNNAGLKVGSLVRASTYKVKIIAGNASYQSGNVIKVTR